MPDRLARIVHVEPGQYEVGSDFIPQAGPVHLSIIAKSFWIDVSPLSWSDYETFVISEGYFRDELWPEALQGQITKLPSSSIDARCRVLRNYAEELESYWGSSLTEKRRLPLTGLSWFEASAICRFYGARLPRESEWEIAMQRSSPPPANSTKDWSSGSLLSDSGCQLFLGLLQEWTADVFVAHYCEANGNQRGHRWNPSAPKQKVAVRGSSPEDVYTHVSYRVGRFPESGFGNLGFRRVWDSKPTDEIVASSQGH